MPTRYPSPALSAGSGFLQGFSSVLTQGLVAQAQEQSQRDASLRETLIKAVTESGKSELLDDPQTQKLLTKGIPKESQPVFLNLLRSLSGGPFEQASRSEKAQFQGATTMPAGGGPTMPASEALQRETPAGAALLMGDKPAYLRAREKEAAPGRTAQDLPGLYQARETAIKAGNWELVKGLTTQIENKSMPEAERAKLRATEIAAAVEPFKEKALTAREEAQMRLFERKLKAKSTGPIPPNLAPHYQMADGSPLRPDISVAQLSQGVQDGSIVPATGIGASLHALLNTLAPGKKPAAAPPAAPPPTPAAAEAGVDLGDGFRINP